MYMDVHVQLYIYACVGKSTQLSKNHLYFSVYLCSYQSKPAKVLGLADHRVVEVSAGSIHSAAVTEDGELYTWGRGTYGRLGHGEQSCTYISSSVTVIDNMYCAYVCRLMKVI